MSDSEVWDLIFHPGLSTAEKITDVSGRGVGMDVVKQNISALGGSVEIDSHLGRGTRVRIRLPLTLAILDGMSVSVGGEIFILPLGYVIESLQPAADDIKSIAGSSRVLRVRGEHLPMLPMAKLFGVKTVRNDNARDGVVVVVESDGRKLALEVDELVGQQQVVVKSIESNYRRVNGISGATILGDGHVALIVDIGGLVRTGAAAA
jgi:two-component system chemotaxis sensor kinase CheA